MINTDDGVDAISGRRKRVTIGNAAKLLAFAVIALFLVMTISVLL